MNKSGLSVHVALFTVSLIYGITFSIVKDIMPYYLQGFGFIVLRVGGAAILFLLASLFYKREKVDWKKHGWRFFICSVTGVMANMLMFFKGLEITTPINGAVLMLATPIFVFLLNVFVNQQRMMLSQLLGILMACAGCALLMMKGNLSFSQQTLPGDVLIILNAISYAAYLVLAKELLKNYHTMTVSKYTFLIGAILVIPFGYTELSHGRFSEMGLEIILKVVFVIVCTTFLTYLLNAWAITKAGPTLVGAYIYLQPIIATIIAVMLKKDSLSMHKIWAILLIFAGVFITSTSVQWFKSKA